ncbi:MAG: HD domain-containing protein, partial [Planctomycetes bacterium]|nr:HD domain-containing protein [Planctomycetota bacterium]
LSTTMGSIVRAMVAAVEARDPYTAGHQRRVARLAVAVATELGLSRDVVEGLRYASMIHDIGKISVPAEILNKPMRLSAPEMELVQTHSQSGFDILKDIDFQWPVARIILQHHERLDGSGYPASAAQRNLSTEVLENIPFASRFGPAAMAMAPGVNPGTGNLSAYGSGGTSSNAYMIDGVDVSDPDAGTIWVFAGYNWIQEVQVVSLGAAAEYGGFSGAASNSLLRSGSNQFHGLFETLFQNQRLTGKNATAAVIEENPDLTPGKTLYSTDTTMQIGGPIKTDKVWFFTSFQYFSPKTTPAGYPPKNPGTGQAWDPKVGGPEAHLEKSPRFIFKPTWQINQNDKITGFVEAERFDVDARGAWANVSPEATRKETSAGWAWNVNWTRVLSSTAVFDVKYAGFWGYYYNDSYVSDTNKDPVGASKLNPSKMGWYDVDEDFYSVNSYYWYHADRLRQQLNASYSQYASGFGGTHNLKFGMEYERGWAKDQDGYPGGGYILAYSGVPYYAYLIDPYIKEAVNSRYTLFAQDSWTIGKRLTINPGVRADIHRGWNGGLNETVFKTTAIAPRVGFALDVFGNGRTVIRGHYGDYYDGAKASFFWAVDPRQPPWYYVEINPVTLQPLWTVTEDDISKVKANRTVADNVKHPFVRQATFGFEHEIMPGFSMGAQYIYRRNKNLIDDVLVISQGGSPGSTFTKADVAVTHPGADNKVGTSDDTTATIPIYKLTSNILNAQYLITNPVCDSPAMIAGCQDAYRQYHAVELTATKKMSNHWMLNASWVISKIVGNYNNTSNSGKSSSFDDPNVDPRYQPFMDGRLTRDSTHLAKLSGIYQGPYGINFAGLFYYITGNTMTRAYRPTRSQVGSGLTRRDMFIEPRGSIRLDPQPNLDIKIDKTFKFGTSRSIGVALEGFNIANNGAITDRTMRLGTSFYNPL